MVQYTVDNESVAVIVRACAWQGRFIFFTPHATRTPRGWMRCFNILIGRWNGRFRDSPFYNDILSGVSASIPTHATRARSMYLYLCLKYILVFRALCCPENHHLRMYNILFCYLTLSYFYFRFYDYLYLQFISRINHFIKHGIF